MRGARWTSEEDALIAEHYPEHGHRWDGWRDILPRRTPGAIRNRASNTGVRSKSKKSHTPESTSLWALYKGDRLLGVGTIRELARQRGCEVCAIHKYTSPGWQKKIAGREDRFITGYRIDEEDE